MRSVIGPKPDFFIALLLTVLLAACAGDQAAGLPGSSVVDSAGIEIVRSEAGSQLRLLSVREVLRIGSVDGPPETQLHLVRRLAVDEGDTIYAPVGGDQIRVFAPDGRHLRTLGREGEGPGEYRGVSAVYVAGDTLAVLDMRLYRVTTLRRDGTVLETAALPLAESGFTTVVGRTADGWLLHAPEQREWPAHGEFIDLAQRLLHVAQEPDVIAALQRVTSSPELARTVLEYGTGRMYGMTMNGVLTGQRPFWQPTQSWAVDRRGRFYRAAGDAYRIDVFDDQGSPLRSIRRSHEPVPITGELRRRLLDAARAHHDTVPARTEFGTDPMETYRFRMQNSPAVHLPVLGRLFVSPGGELLVERPDLAEDPVARSNGPGYRAAKLTGTCSMGVACCAAPSCCHRGSHRTYSAMAVRSPACTVTTSTSSTSSGCESERAGRAAPHATARARQAGGYDCRGGAGL